MHALNITCAGVHDLHGFSFTPRNTPKASVIIAPAMGVTQDYYHPLANWLARQGFTVVTFDYSGIGRSRVQDLRDYQVDILDFARLDCSAVLMRVNNTYANQDVVWLGHSLGGQIFILIKHIENVKKVITISAGTGYWRHNVPALKRKTLLFWLVIVPA